MKIDINSDVLNLFNNITLDIRDYISYKAQERHCGWECCLQTYNQVIFSLSDNYVTIEIAKDEKERDYVKLFTGNRYSSILLVNTEHNKFLVVPYTGKNKLLYYWNEKDLDKFIDIVRTRFHEYLVKINSEQKEHNFKLRIITDAIDPYVDNLSYTDIDNLVSQLRLTLDWVRKNEDNKMVDDSNVKYLEDRIKELKQQIEEIEQRHYEELDPVKQELEDTEWELASARVIFESQKNEDVVDDE